MSGKAPGWHMLTIEQQAKDVLEHLKIKPKDAAEEQQYLEEIIEYIIKPVRQKRMQ